MLAWILFTLLILAIAGQFLMVLGLFSYFATSLVREAIHVHSSR